MEEAFRNEYYAINGLGALGGVYRLYRELKRKNPDISYMKVKEWLNKQDSYNLFKQVKKNFIRLPIIVKNIDEQWQADLMDLTWLQKSNEGYKYVLNVIDCFSRFTWSIPLKSKTTDEVINAFSKILSTGRKPMKLQTDQGKEFTNNRITKFFTDNNIHHFTTTDDLIKCAIVERLNRTLRTRLYRYLSYKNTHKYIDIWKDLISSYNDSFHRTIQMTPSDVTEQNRSKVLYNIRKSHRIIKSLQKPYHIGQQVRISRKKNLFEKGATSNFSEEIYKICKVKKTPQGYVYYLKDTAGEKITSIFYHYELTPAVLGDLFNIEVLKTRINKRTNKKEYFVKWIGYPNKFNSWVENVEST